MGTVDVVVVGAGPAGAAAAIDLARRGRDVVVIDKAVFPRDKCCGDGLTTGALRQLDALGLDPRTVASWQPVDGCWVRSPSGRTVEFPFPHNGLYGAVARRADLDAAILELARASGVKVHEDHAFAALSVSEQGVTVTVDGREPISARYVVAADGMWSPVRKALGLVSPGYLGEWHAFRQYLHATGEDHRRLWVWFEKELLPGYAWSFPLPGGIVNVGFGIRRTPGQATRSMAEVWRRLLEIPHIARVVGEDPVAESPHRAWPLPARLPTTTLAGACGRVLFVGDAARATDPMTGEGIGQAIETGRLAGEAIGIAGPDHPQSAADHYRTVVDRGIAVDQRLSSALSRALATPAGVRAAVRVASSTAWTRGNFARWLFEDYPRALLATPRRWHAGMLSGPGAFGSRTAADPSLTPGSASR
ncbi:MAG: hypothetical protein NVS3B12_12670 [Acidimicrobiales bacterium]